MKKILLLLPALLLFTSCILNVPEDDDPAYVGTWEYKIDNNTSRRIKLESSSYTVSSIVYGSTGKELESLEKEKGELGTATSINFILTKTHKWDTIGIKLYEIAPSDQTSRNVSWRVTGSELVLVDSDSDNIYVSGTYTKK